jgi:phage terminase small subunit
VARKPTKRITTKRVQATENQPAPVIPDVTVKPEIDEDPLTEGVLTIRQRRFVDALVGPAGGNATKAAEMAGYAAENRLSLRVTAAQNLTKPNVQEAIAHAYAKLKDSPEWARANLVDLASSSMANFVTVDEQGETSLDFSKAVEAGAMGQIKEYREEKLAIAGSSSAVIKRTVKLHDRTAALTTLLKLQGKLVERHEHTGPDGKPIEQSVTHEFDFNRYADLYRQRNAVVRGNGDGEGIASANGN